MYKKIQYIKCPECNGIIKMNNDDYPNIGSCRVLINNRPTCQEYGQSYDIRIETFEVGEVVQSRRTSKFYEVERVSGENIECRNDNFTTVTFKVEEITKVNPEIIKELEYIFARKYKDKSDPF
ncbi:hypothetical protein SAMN04487886_11376 [Clostridium sp. DSM 8431]|uniref:hypothetical protein n=1 Tax=Clostridium sp. DSM 8431 TaxID=1761781 RepID=UPI0008E48ECA|nr:hypothetical protein [Clostridium sp. DSM 8431]SFU75587.1 hypothetical protein SAMN04487886_11376 [Clostridium sp. DSM 8431]